MIITSVTSKKFINCYWKNLYIFFSLFYILEVELFKMQKNLVHVKNMFQSLCIYTDYILYYCIREILVHLLCICVKNQFMLGNFFFSVCDVFCDTMCIYHIIVVCQLGDFRREWSASRDQVSSGNEKERNEAAMFTSA